MDPERMGYRSGAADLGLTRAASEDVTADSALYEGASRAIGGVGGVALAPSHPAHPSRLPAVAADGSGPVAVTFRLVRRSPADSVGWTVNNDDLRIIRVAAGTPAAVAGIKEGMRVADINGKPVRTVGEMKTALEEGTVFNVTVEMPKGPGELPPVGSHVVVNGVTHPPDAVALNGRDGLVVGHRGSLAMVQVAEYGIVPLPAANLTPADQESSWCQVENPDVGRVYYWNTATGETSWDHPLAERLPPGLEEVQLAKQPHEGLGLKLDDMVLSEVRDGTPADRCNVHQFLGWRLTHVGGIRVTNMAEVMAMTQQQESVRLRFEVEELTVRKEVDERLGCELKGMLLSGVVPGSALERSLDGDLGAVLGQRLTHVNGARVSSVAHVAARAVGCDAVRLRFEIEQMEVPREPGQRLGLLLEGMRLQGCERDSPSKIAGAARFVGRRLTHVNGIPVHGVGDVSRAAAAHRPGEPSIVLLRFETAVEEETREEMIAAGEMSGPGRIVQDMAVHAALPLRTQPDPPPPPDPRQQPDPRVALLERRIADLEAHSALPHVITPEWSPAARVLVGPPPWEGRPGQPPPITSGHVAVRPDTALARRETLVAAQRATSAIGDHCVVCNSVGEVDCLDCAGTFCRPCCLRFHSNEHTAGANTGRHNILARRPPATPTRLDPAPATPPQALYGYARGGYDWC
eukprot:TRINITY_DN19945_c0_g1_i1.p1 TRINITY_DN19945_c0_g1~~TRINITY_DN19945_c0_g1_i1.p1  ORF type:complete len:690 (+),score=167.53 TRINITY_DN19945_c0_g1_i1:123-2192(+)